MTVAPCMGAWIETYTPQNYTGFTGSHPVWVRGLKPYNQFKGKYFVMSHPVWVRGLKQI